jgi:hypothetical protein
MKPQTQGYKMYFIMNFRHSRYPQRQLHSVLRFQEYRFHNVLLQDGAGLLNLETGETRGLAACIPPGHSAYISPGTILGEDYAVMSIDDMSATILIGEHGVQVALAQLGRGNIQFQSGNRWFTIL